METFPKFRFTLNNSIAGQMVITEPGGWDNSVLKLERNKVFHSLVEYYDQPFTFIGDNTEGDGGLDYIKEIERSQGPDAQITVEVEISVDGGATYETLFEGLIDIPSCKEIDFYKAEYAIIRNDFWQKFMNRMETPVNLNATNDLDGNSITAIATSTMTMLGQGVRRIWSRADPYMDSGGTVFSEVQETSVPTTSYILIDTSLADRDEISDRFEYGTQISSEDPLATDKFLFKVKEAGSYALDLSLAGEFSFNTARTYDLKWYYAYKTNGVVTGPTQFGTTESGISSTGFEYLNKDLSTTLTLDAGAEIYIYGVLVLNGVTDVTFWPDHHNSATMDIIYTRMEIIADTTYPDTTASSILLLDAAKNIVSKITGSYPGVISNYLSFNSGCGSNYRLTKGKYVRGVSTSDKPFYMSFDDWWKGAQPILGLGLGYTSGNSIEIEPVEDFYDSEISVLLDFVNNIVRTYSQDHIYRTINIGYEKWAAESAFGNDDFQTKKVYRTRFKTIGTELSLMSKFYAASLGIEETRRNRVEEGKDWRLDEDIMIIAVRTGNSTLPEFSGPFSATAGVTLPTTRYNFRISPARNLLRWRNFLSGCLKWYYEIEPIEGTRKGFMFASGEGNVDSSSTLLSTDCEYNLYSYDLPPFFYGLRSVADDLNITPSENYVVLPIIYEFEHPMTWAQYKAIRDNRKKAIGISRTDTGHVPLSVMRIEYNPTRGKAKIIGLLRQSEPIT